MLLAGQSRSLGDGGWRGPRRKRWVEILHRLRIDELPHKLYGIPEEDGVGSLLALVDGGEGQACCPGATPCRELIPGLWIPCDAEPHTAVRAEDGPEVRSAPCFVLPSGRVIKLVEEAQCELGHLLDLSIASAQNWSAAVVREPFRLRLTSVVVPDLSSPEDLIKEGGEGVGGKDPRELRSLGDKLAESGPGQIAGKAAGAAGAAAFGAIAGIASALGRILPGRKGGAGGGGAGSGTIGDGGDSWMGRLAEWANTNLARLQERQARSLDRLKDMMKNNPELGLQYALPLSGEEGRGLAPPSDALHRHGLDFSLGRLFGGRRGTNLSLVGG